jgi:hypothetical protein
VIDLKIDIKKISQIDLKLSLIAGDSIYVDNFEIKQLKIKEIREKGYERYQQMVSLLTIDKEELAKLIEFKEDIDSMNVYDIIIASENIGLLGELIISLKFFLNEEEVIYHENFGLVFGKVEDGKILNSKNFNYISDAIKYTNCLYSVDKDKLYNPQNEKAMSIIKKLKKGREKTEKIKSAKSEGKNDMDIADIISAVSCNSKHYNKNNIWDITIYQLYDEFRGIDKFVSYNTNVLAAINGAKVDLKHWASKSE